MSNEVRIECNVEVLSQSFWLYCVANASGLDSKFYSIRIQSLKAIIILIRHIKITEKVISL